MRFLKRLNYFSKENKKKEKKIIIIKKKFWNSIHRIPADLGFMFTWDNG
jgi:hypothetical protein